MAEYPFIGGPWTIFRLSDHPGAAPYYITSIGHDSSGKATVEFEQCVLVLDREINDIRRHAASIEHRGGDAKALRDVVADLERRKREIIQ